MGNSKRGAVSVSSRTMKIKRGETTHFFKCTNEMQSSTHTHPDPSRSTLLQSTSANAPNHEIAKIGLV